MSDAGAFKVVVVVIKTEVDAFENFCARGHLNIIAVNVDPVRGSELGLVHTRLQEQ